MYEHSVRCVSCFGAGRENFLNSPAPGQPALLVPLLQDARARRPHVHLPEHDLEEVGDLALLRRSQIGVERDHLRGKSHFSSLALLMKDIRI